MIRSRFFHVTTLTGLMLVALAISGCLQREDQVGRKLESAKVINESLKEELKQLKDAQTPSLEGLDARIGELQEEVATLKAENSELKKEFKEYKKKYPLR